MSETQKDYIVRVESAVANRYGLGEKISENVYLFKVGNFGLTKEELAQAIARTGRNTQ